jgi:CheY-like chemotaxis protein
MSQWRVAHTRKPEHTSAPGAPPPEGASERPRLRVLLAEDDLINRHVAVVILGRQDMAVTPVADGTDAFEKGKTGEFDLILMDRMMPGMDGLEATRRLLAYWQAAGIDPVPIVGLSGLVSNEDREECVAAGMSGFVGKPVVADELLAELSRVSTPEPEAIDLKRTQSDLADPRELVDEVLPVFLGQTGDRLATIDAALEARDAPAIHAQTHPLKTAALYLGATSLSAVAKAVDDICRLPEEPDWATVEPLIAQLHHEVDRVAAWREQRAADDS